MAIVTYGMRSVCVTGGAGFIGSNFVRMLAQTRPGLRVVNYDALTYAGNLENVADLKGRPGYFFVKGDIRDGEAVRRVLREHQVDAIVNFAAESHVDRSILSAAAFVSTNVDGTRVLLEAAQELGIGRFVQVSTDEVYGSLGPDDDKFTETTPLAPNSPYSASKAGADLLCRAWHHTHGLPVVVTRCSNNYGPYQFPEKLIPLMIVKAMADERLPVYGDGMNVRDWIHVGDHCTGVLAAAERGKPGEVYNFGAGNECPNIEIVKLILAALGKPDSLIQYVKDRPGHDRRYAIDSSKTRAELGWTPIVTFADGLRQAVAWYRANEPWWRRVMTGEYLKYYENNYAHKMA
jgi:dTDP-glucose 4,6-dehydratase